jgi:hypothetical protein
MHKRLVWLTIAVGAILIFSPDAKAKYRGFAAEFFFDRHPGAAGAATGRTGVTSSGDITNTFFNPAGLADAAGVGFCFSWSNPYYDLGDAEYRYVGGNVRVGDYGAVGLSRYNLDYGPVMGVGAGGDGRTGTNDAAVLVLTLAGEPVKDLLVGANLSAFRYTFDTDRGPSQDDASAYWADIGVLKYFDLGRTEASGHWLKLGGSLSNLTYSSVDILEAAEDLPVALRLGAAYEMGWWGLTRRQGLRTVETVAQVEYQDILNYEHRTAVKLGGEIRLIEVLALRLGYYRETVEDYGQDVNKDSIESTTYGFGVHLPMQKITEGKLPLRVGLDYVNMKQPEYTKSADTENFTTFTFCASYYF